MKRILFFLILAFLSTLFLNINTLKTVFAQQYSCSNRNPSCPQDQYPNCQTAVYECNPPGCIVSMYLRNGGYVLDCAYPPTINPPPPGSNYCGWDSNNNPVDYCVPPFIAVREEDPNTGHRSCTCRIPQPTPTPLPQDRCPVCPEGYHYHFAYLTCCKNNETPECKTSTFPNYVNCLSTGKTCVPGCGCGSESCAKSPNGTQPTPCKQGEPGEGIQTALGCIPTKDTAQFVGWLLGSAIKIAGGIAFLLIILGAIKVLTSSGNPEAVKAGQEMITSALMGLLFIIFSLFLLELIGVKILQIPGFGQ